MEQQQTCPICGKTLPTNRRSLGVHIALKHPNQKRCCKCGIELTEENRHKNGKCAKRNLCKKCHNQRSRVFYRKPTLYEKHKQQSRLTKIKVKLEIYALLGNKCVQCGFNDWRAFQIDHVNNNGHIEKKKFGSYGSTYLTHVLNQLKQGSKEYQLLCANCNQIKIARLDDIGQLSTCHKTHYMKNFNGSAMTSEQPQPLGIIKESKAKPYFPP